jgi:hypothetical protein
MDREIPFPDGHKRGERMKRDDPKNTPHNPSRRTFLKTSGIAGLSGLMTAYEIPSCDWSSDVCSSDLIHLLFRSASDVYKPMLMDRPFFVPTRV